MIIRTFAVLMLMTSLSLSAFADLKISNGDGATIDDLIREKILVTIMLTGNVRDPNLQITEVNDSTITFITSDGMNSAYPLSKIAYIRVQDDRVAGRGNVFSKGTLSKEEQRIVDRARQRIVELFSSETDPVNRMRAACLAAILGEDGGRMYLEGHAQGNDTPTAVLATRYLWLAGQEIDEGILTDGFLHGNRDTRLQTALLAGIHGTDDYLKELRYMADDPHPEVNPVALRALSKLGDRWVVPYLYEGLSALKQAKNEAAIYGLIELGDESIIKELKLRLPLANSSEWFRIVRVLYALGDDKAEVMMREEALTTYAHEETAGILLGENDDWEGGVWIRSYLEKQKDPNYRNLMFQANLAAALYGTAQSQAKIVFQKMMRMEVSQVYAKGNTSNTEYKKVILAEIQEEVCRLLGEKGDKTMLSLVYTPMESKNSSLALAACEAIVMIANKPYRERRVEYSKYSGYRETMLPDFFN